MDADEFRRVLRAMPEAERRKLFDDLDRKHPSQPLHRTPNLSDPAEAMAHRAMAAIQRAFREEFMLEAVGPNVTIVVAVPPDGKIGIASTEPDPNLVLYALKMGQGAVQRSVRLNR